MKRYTTLLFSVLMLSAFSHTLHAQTSARNLFIRGIQSFDEGDLPAVIDAMKQALRAGSLSILLQIEAYKHLGIAYMQLGRQREAESAFRQLLRLKPGYRIGASAGPDVVSLFTQTRFAPPTPGKKWLKIVIPFAVVAAGTAIGIPLATGGKGNTGNTGNTGSTTLANPPSPPSR